MGWTHVDDYTRKDIKDGHLSNTGKVHFSDRIHLLELFKELEITQLEHKVFKQEIPYTDFTIASWNLVAEKRNLSIG
ncbi:hypothetical protein D3C73_1313430 [compost metagenome]